MHVHVRMTMCVTGQHDSVNMNVSLHCVKMCEYM